MITFGYYGPTLNPSPDMLLKLLDYRGDLGIDIETVSLVDRTPICLAMAISPREAFYFPIDSPMLPWQKLLDPGIRKVFHNASFDVTILERSKGTRVENYVDTIVAAHILGLPPKLTMLAEILSLPIPPNIEDLIGQRGQKQLRMVDVPEENRAEKCARDAEAALAVWEKLEDLIPMEAFNLDMALLPVLGEMEQRGIRVDVLKLEEHKQRLTKEVGFYKQIAKGYGFNPGSSMQVAYVLGSRGHPIKYKRSTGKPIMDEEMLTTMYRDDPIAQLVLLYRRSRVLLSTFVEAILNKHLVGDRIHPHFNLWPRSGRLSTTPNSQNIPVAIRNIYIPSDGNEFEVWDLEQIELRVVAYLSQDSAMLQMFANGEDVHEATARDLNVDRGTAKTLNYAILYGGDAHTLFVRGGIPMDKGKMYLERYFAKFRGIKAWIDETKAGVMQTGYAITMLGRKRGFPDVQSSNYFKREKALREAINHPIQGTAAEIQKRSAIAVASYPLVNIVHDENDFDKPVGMDIPIPLNLAPFETPVEIGRGKNWKDAKS